jgi:hypothetical protein
MKRSREADSILTSRISLLLIKVLRHNCVMQKCSVFLISKVLYFKGSSNRLENLITGAGRFHSCQLLFANSKLYVIYLA